MPRFIRKPPDCEVAEENIYFTCGDQSLGMPLRTYLRARAKWDKTVAEYYAREAEVVPIRRGRGHAARS